MTQPELGVVTLWMPGGQTTVLLLPVAHRLIGSLILGVAVALAVRVSGIEVNHVPVLDRP